jgi:hypothetical protein
VAKQCGPSGQKSGFLFFIGTACGIAVRTNSSAHACTTSPPFLFPSPHPGTRHDDLFAVGGMPDNHHLKFQL